MKDRKTSYVSTLSCLILLAHSFVMLWGTGVHLHLLPDIHKTFAVHHHQDMDAKATLTTGLEAEGHRHPVTVLILTAIYARTRTETSQLPILPSSPIEVVRVFIPAVFPPGPSSWHFTPLFLPDKDHRALTSGTDPPSFLRS